jgi:hypothetical protein
MIQDTLLSKSLQLSQWVLHSQRTNLESNLGSGWNTATSQLVDACLELEAAIDRFTGNLVPLLSHRSLGPLCRVRRYDLHGFEPVGSIMPRVLRGIDAAAHGAREGAQR